MFSGLARTLVCARGPALVVGRLMAFTLTWCGWKSGRFGTSGVMVVSLKMVVVYLFLAKYPP